MVVTTISTTLNPLKKVNSERVSSIRPFGIEIKLVLVIPTITAVKFVAKYPLQVIDLSSTNSVRRDHNNKSKRSSRSSSSIRSTRKHQVPFGQHGNNIDIERKKRSLPINIEKREDREPIERREKIARRLIPKEEQILTKRSTRLLLQSLRRLIYISVLYWILPLPYRTHLLQPPFA